MPDIKNLPAGDNTEIGERGINLSGGQKARICLARAVYSDKQVLLLDDPLSSVDNRVANHIFYNCFKKLLKNKTILLVAHRLDFLDKVDRVVELRQGKIFNVTKGFKDQPENSQSSQTKVEENTKPNSLIEDEDRETGEVNKEVYLDYQRFSGSYVWIVLAIVSMVL